MLRAVRRRGQDADVTVIHSVPTEEDLLFSDELRGMADNGLIDNWLRAIKALYHQSLEQFTGLDEEARVDLLCELNVQRQVRNVCHTTVVQNAWKRGQELTVHGWIYGLKDGLVKDLGVSINAAEQLDGTFLYQD